MNNSCIEKKNYLYQYQELKSLLEEEAEKAGYWRERAISPQAQRFDTNRANPAGINPIDEFLELAAECQKRFEELEAKKEEILQAIKCLKNPTCRNILIKKYINGKNFDTIAKEMNYSLSHVWNTHRKALKDFELPNVSDL